MNHFARTAVVGGAVALMLGGGLAVMGSSATIAAGTCVRGAASDFNGDGISDVAIGEPQNGGGRVHVLYGTRSGLRADATASTPDDVLISSPGDADGHFGFVVVALDFNGDGCSDLAVSTPFSTTPSAGTGVAGGFVSIFLGSPGTGINPNNRIDIDGRNGNHTPQRGDQFGWSLAAGNFKGDGKQELVVGARFEDNGGGAVYVIPSDPVARVGAGQRFVQGQDGVPAGDGMVDEFGFALATGDFNADGLSDLAIGEPFFGNLKGAVVVLNGSATSMVSGSTAKRWTQDTTDSAGHGISGTAEQGDDFGLALAAGNFNGSGGADLAVGVPGEALGTVLGAGLVNVIYSGGAGGLVVTGNQGWTQNSTGISGTAESFDDFGSSLAAGDFNGNGRTDLAIGVPGEGLGTATGAGMVNVIMGSSTGLTAAGQQAWSQATAGIAGGPETNDSFGRALAVGRIHSAARDDLIVGVQGEGIGAVGTAGEIQLIPASTSGLTATGSQSFSAAATGVQGDTVANGAFGTSVS